MTNFRINGYFPIREEKYFGNYQFSADVDNIICSGSYFGVEINNLNISASAPSLEEALIKLQCKLEQYLTDHFKENPQNIEKALLNRNSGLLILK